MKAGSTWDKAKGWVVSRYFPHSLSFSLEVRQLNLCKLYIKMMQLHCTVHFAMSTLIGIMLDIFQVH